MSDAFRCDGCDCYYSGRPAVEVSLGVNTLSVPLTLTHRGGYDDVDPEGVTREVSFAGCGICSSFDLCVLCAVDEGLVEALDKVLAGGRYDSGRHA